MKKVSMIAVAVAGALFSGTTMAAEVDFHGYMNAGFGMNADGGSAYCYGNGGPASHKVGRLGDECDVYAELALNANKLYEKDGDSFNVHTLVAYGTLEDGGKDGRGNNFQAIGTNAETPWTGGRAAFREAWVDYSMANGMKLWGGNRYYGRKDVHIQDFYYVNNSGEGFGIENVEVGPGKFHAALVQHKWKAPLATSDDPSTPEDERKLLEDEQVYSTVNTIDLRYTGLNVNEDGTLELILLAAKPSYSDKQEDAIKDSTGNVGDYGLDETGLSLTVEHTQGNFFGGFNKFVAQYSTEGYAWDGYGINGHLGSGYNLEQGQEGRKSMRFINWGVVAGDKWDLGYSVTFSRLENGDGKTGTRSAVVVRPSYYWTETMSTVFEGGYYVQDDPWMDDSEDLQKITIAQQWQAGASIWARPAIRVFASKYTGDQAVDNHDLMFGVNVEAWW